MENRSGLTGVAYVLVLIALIGSLTAAVAAIVYTVVVPAVVDGRSISVRTDVSAAAIGDLPANVRPAARVPVSVEIEDPSLGESLAVVGIGTVQLAVAIVVASFLLRIVNSVRKGDPFNSDNVRRLRGIALTLLIGWPIGQLLSQILGSGLAERAGVRDDGFVLAIGGPLPIAGIGVLVLGEVFRHGIRLREDVEATI